MKSFVMLFLVLVAALFCARYPFARPWAEFVVVLWVVIVAHTIWEKWREPRIKDRKDEDWVGVWAWAILVIGPLVGGWLMGLTLGSKWYAVAGAAGSLIAAYLLSGLVHRASRAIAPQWQAACKWLRSVP